MKCPSCGTDLPDFASFCTVCGSEVAPKAADAVNEQPEQDNQPNPVNNQSYDSQNYSAPNQGYNPQYNGAPYQAQGATKFCKNCGKKISEAAVVCPLCGAQVETLKQDPASQPNIVINNNNANNNVNTVVGGVGGTLKNKWVAFLLCLFLGGFGAHKFYEGKIGMGILYLCTGGLFCIGWIIDLIRILFYPTNYYV